MSLRELPFARNMSEFVSGRHATCQELSILGGLHAVFDGQWPMNAAGLETITKEMIAHGWAGAPGGASDSNEGQAWLRMRGYQTSWLDIGRIEAELAAWGGLMPLVIEYDEHRGTLPGDEGGVQYHYNCCVGWDPIARSGTFVDGDNIVVRRTSDGYGPLATYTLEEVARAAINGYRIETSFRLDISDPVVARYYTQISPTHWHCKLTGFEIYFAMLDYYRTISAPESGLNYLGLPLSNEVLLKVPSGRWASFQVFQRGVLIYDPTHEWDSPPGATHEVYWGHLDREPVKSYLAKMLGGAGALSALSGAMIAPVSAADTPIVPVVPVSTANGPMFRNVDGTIVLTVPPSSGIYLLPDTASLASASTAPGLPTS